LDSALRECLDETLRDTLGNSAAQALLFHLDFDLPGELASSISKQLHQLLGSGAAILERVVSKCMYERFGVSYTEDADLDLVTTMKSLGGRIEPMKEKSR
jgi:hypothetical protein